MDYDEFLCLKIPLKWCFKFKNAFQNFRNYHKLSWTKIPASLRIINRRYEIIHIYLQLLCSLAVIEFSY